MRHSISEPAATVSTSCLDFRRQYRYCSCPGDLSILRSGYSSSDWLYVFAYVIQFCHHIPSLLEETDHQCAIHRLKGMLLRRAVAAIHHPPRSQKHFLQCRQFSHSTVKRAEIELTIDGKKVRIEQGAALIQACEKAGVQIPR